MSKGNVYIFRSVDELAAFFAEKLANLTHACPGNAHVSVALSGGSTPRAVFAHLSRQTSHHIAWDKILFFWGDERCVPPDHEESNYRMTKESLFNHVPVLEENIFRIQGEEDPWQEAIRYSKLVAERITNAGNNPVFDIVMLGLGEDGHTASIFPPDIELFDSPSLFIAAKNPYSGQHRISATGKVVNHAKNVFFLVTGKSKSTIVAQVIQKQAGYETLPASRVKPASNQLFWLLDQQAASFLSGPPKQTLKEKTLSWEARIGLMTNPVVLKQTALTIIGAGLFMAFLLSFIFAASGEFGDIIPMLWVSLLVTAGLWVFVVLIMLVFFGNRVRVRFTLSEKGVLWETVDKRVLRTNRLAIIAGVLGRSAQVAGAGTLAASREKEFISWKEVVSVKTNPKHLQIVLRNSWRTIMLVVCNPDNFEMAVNYMAEKVPPVTKHVDTSRKKLANPLWRTLLRSLAVTVASIPLFALSEPLDMDIFIPLLLYCFALAMVWLIPLFGWVVICCAVILAVQLAMAGINEYYYLYGFEKLLFILAYAGLACLIWFSRGALRGK